MSIDVKIKKVRDCATIPTYGTQYSAGADLYAAIDAPVLIRPGTTRPIPTGFAIEIPEDFAALIYARSGLASKKGLAPANKVGVIDSDYRGEVVVMLHNHGKDEQFVDPGDRIAQLVFTPTIRGVFHEVDELSDTIRGAGGFGSTGV